MAGLPVGGRHDSSFFLKRGLDTVARSCRRRVKALLQVETSDSDSDVKVTSQSLIEKKNEDKFKFLKGPHETRVCKQTGGPNGNLMNEF